MNEIEQAIAGFETDNALLAGSREVRTIERNKLALAALREQAEREKGCIFCSGERHCIREAFDEGTAKVISADNRYALSVGTSRDAAIFNIFFCPMCGKRLEVEP